MRLTNPKHGKFYEYLLKAARFKYKPTLQEMSEDLGYASPSGVYRLVLVMIGKELFKPSRIRGEWMVKNKKGEWI